MPSIRATAAARALEVAAGVASSSVVHAPAVDLILTGDVRNIALIDGRFVEVGHEVGDFQVVSIDSDAVTLRDRQGALLRVRAESDRTSIAGRGRGTTGSSQP